MPVSRIVILACVAGMLIVASVNEALAVSVDVPAGWLGENGNYMSKDKHAWMSVYEPWQSSLGWTLIMLEMNCDTLTFADDGMICVNYEVLGVERVIVNDHVGFLIKERYDAVYDSLDREAISALGYHVFVFDGSYATYAAESYVDESHVDQYEDVLMEALFSLRWAE